MSAARALSTFRTNEIECFLLVKTEPAGWADRTMLLRILQKDGDEMMIQISSVAGLRSVGSMEELRAYVLQFPGKYLKKAKSAPKNGVGGEWEVRANGALVVHLCKEAWPLKVPYQLTPFMNLNQREKGDWVDAVGVVLHVGAVDRPGTLAKREIFLGNGEFSVTLELLGEKVFTKMAKDDILAIKGARIGEWQGQRSLSTGLLTFMEVNPRNNSAIVKPEKLEDGSPLKKAMKMRMETAITLSQLRRLMHEVRTDAESGSASGAIEERTFTTQASIVKFDNHIFQGDAPFFGEAGLLKFRVRTTLVDATDTIENATIWQAAAREIFQTSAEHIASMWEGCDDERLQTELLATLNMHAEKTYALNGTLKTWRFGRDQDRIDVQVSIHSAEKID